MDNRYMPRSRKPISTHNLALFSGKIRKLPKDNREQHKEAFRLIIHDKMKKKLS